MLFSLPENGICSLWTEEEDNSNDSEVDEEDVTVPGALGGQEVDGIDPICDCIAYQREIGRCIGDRWEGRWFEEEVEERDEEEEG